MSLLFLDPPHCQRAWESSYRNAEIKGSGKLVWLYSFCDDNENREDDDGYVFPEELFCPDICSPVFGLYCHELFYKHFIIIIVQKLYPNKNDFITHTKGIFAKIKSGFIS